MKSIDFSSFSIPTVTGGPQPGKTTMPVAAPQEATKSLSQMENAELMKACASMEAQFVNYLFKAMRETIPDDGFIPKGPGEKMYTSMLDLQLAENLCQNGGIGLASVLYEQLADAEDPESNEELHKNMKK